MCVPFQIEGLRPLTARRRNGSINDDLTILRSEIDADRRRLVDALGLKKQGNRYFCHACQCDGRPHCTADLSIEAGFKCHKCGWSGDGLSLAMAVQRCDFPAALAFVRSVYGVPAASPPCAAVPKRGKLHPLIDDAASAAHCTVNQRAEAPHVEAGRWFYHDAQGAQVACVLRFNREDGDGKTFRPVHRDGTGWRIGDPPGLWPLYNLPAILSSSAQVFIVGGEKCAEAAGSIGLVCTTSAHGAKSPSKTDWSPLAGRVVCILPDCDDAGQAYALAVTRILSALSPPARLRTVRLPDLTSKCDIFNFIRLREANARKSS